MAFNAREILKGSDRTARLIAQGEIDRRRAH